MVLIHGKMFIAFPFFIHEQVKLAVFSLLCIEMTVYLCLLSLQFFLYRHPLSSF